MVPSFEWDAENLLHIARHDVSREEVEEVLSGSTLEVGYDTRNFEERFREVGRTKSGRFLEIVTTVRGENVRVVTAFDASRIAIRRYLESR